MATSRLHSPAGARQEQEEVRRCRRTMQRLLGGLAARLPAQQTQFQTGTRLEFHRAAQAHAPGRRKGA